MQYGLEWGLQTPIFWGSYILGHFCCVTRWSICRGEYCPPAPCPYIIIQSWVITPVPPPQNTFLHLCIARLYKLASINAIQSKCTHSWLSQIVWLRSLDKSTSRNGLIACIVSKSIIACYTHSWWSSHQLHMLQVLGTKKASITGISVSTSQKPHISYVGNSIDLAHI